MGNLSVLDRNIIHAFGALEHADEAERVYLAKRDRSPPLESEVAAYAWANACQVVIPGIRASERLFDGVDHGVLDFVRTRFLNMGATA